MKKSLLSFPKTIMEFQRRFQTEEDCWNYIVDLRWPEGFICPRCGSDLGAFIETRGTFQCEEGHQISATTDTVMHRTHLPLLYWLWSAFLMTTQTPGISSVVLARQLGIHQESAYMILQRLRAGMVDPERTKLSGKIEIDEGFISAGRVRKVRAGRESGKPIIICAVEFKGDLAGRCRLRRIDDASEESIMKFIRQNVEKGSTIYTDGWMGYNNISEYGYHHRIVEGEDSVEVAEQLPHVHRIFSNLKAWLIGTHHGVSAKHLQAYCNEFVFRYNRRRNPMSGFLSALGIAVNVEGPEYEELYSTGDMGGWVHPNPPWMEE